MRASDGAQAVVRVTTYLASQLETACLADWDQIKTDVSVVVLRVGCEQSVLRDQRYKIAHLVPP